MHYPDPDVSYGPFRVLPRTDGGFVVTDMRRPKGDQTVGNKHKSLKAACIAARTYFINMRGKK